MAAPIRASFNDIVAAMKTRLVTKLKLSANLVRSVARSGPVPHFDSDHNILLRIRNPIPQQEEYVTPDGRIATVLLRHVAAICRTRLGMDNPDTDDVWLHHPTLGHIAFEEAVLDALQIYWPETKTGDVLTIEPIRLDPSADPEKLQDDPHWGQSALVFAIRYMPPLNQADQ